MKAVETRTSLKHSKILKSLGYYKKSIYIWDNGKFMTLGIIRVNSDLSLNQFVSPHIVDVEAYLRNDMNLGWEIKEGSRYSIRLFSRSTLELIWSGKTTSNRPEFVLLDVSLDFLTISSQFSRIK